MFKYKTAKLLAVLVCVIIAAVSVCACRHKTDPSHTADASDKPIDPEMTEAVPAVTDNTDQPVQSDLPDNTQHPIQSDSPDNSQYPVPTETGSLPDPTAIPSSSPDPFSTPQPTATPKPDTVTELAWLKLNDPAYCDLDFDGKSEKIVLNLGNGKLTLTVTTGTGSVLNESFAADGFICAAVNNFNTGDNRVEIAVSAQKGNKLRTTKMYRLNNASSSLISCEIDGWIDSIDGNALSIHRYADIMGTWECMNSFTLRHDAFSLAAENKMWTVVHEPDRFCTVAADMLVGIYSTGSENISAFLVPGDKLYPVATDLETLIDIRIASGENGYLSITLSPGGDILYSGKTMDNWFVDLSYLN